ncbi:MAG: peptide chain release factor 2 [Alphaproteobacteria bacterium]
MRAELETVVEKIKQSLDLLRRHLDWDKAVKRLAELNAQAEDPDLWSNQCRAQAVMRERTQLQASIAAVQEIDSKLKDTVDLLELADAEGDEGVAAEAEKALIELRDFAGKRELESLLSGEADKNDSFVEVHAGAGGTESQDWAEMLARMYVRWAEQHGYKVEWLEESAGEEAGVKSATFKVIGPNAYGWLKNESGVHRLVRISPFDAQSRRHTSFASVWVYPVVDETIVIDIQDNDLRVDTYRASGAGGQHVNKTDSAIRITHIPSGIVVQCQNQRSQHKNRAEAMSMLRARMYEQELQKREEATKQAHEAKSDIGWGHQIRSYVLQPYQMVKDLRTGVEIGNAQKVLDGGIDPFLQALLAARLQGGQASASKEAG